VARILIVDDEPDLRGMVRLILELDGHQVHEAHHGRAALERLAETEVDLVITDVMMPIMSGSDLINRLRAEKSTAELPIMVLSASPHQVANANRVMHKPFDPGDLRDNVKGLVAAP
jgi:DNA-binding response OmpR family regulator